MLGLYLLAKNVITSGLGNLFSGFKNADVRFCSHHRHIHTMSFGIDVLGIGRSNTA